MIRKIAGSTLTPERLKTLNETMLVMERFWTGGGEFDKLINPYLNR